MYIFYKVEEFIMCVDNICIVSARIGNNFSVFTIQYSCSFALEKNDEMYHLD